MKYITKVNVNCCFYNYYYVDNADLSNMCSVDVSRFDFELSAEYKCEDDQKTSRYSCLKLNEKCICFSLVNI